MPIAELLLLHLTGWFSRQYVSILEECVRAWWEPDSCVIHQEWFCSVLCRMCRQRWSICRLPHRRYKCLRFPKMTDHYYTGAGATGGLLIWIIAWRWAEIDSSHWLGRHQDDQEHDTAAGEGDERRCREDDVAEQNQRRCWKWCENVFFFCYRAEKCYTCASVGSTSPHINSLIFDCGILIQLALQALELAVPAAEIQRLIFRCVSFHLRKIISRRNALFFSFRLFTEHKREEQSNGQTHRMHFWVIIIFKKKRKWKRTAFFWRRLKHKCVQPSLQLKRLRSRAAPRALHAAKSTVNAWGAGKSVSRLLRGRQSSFRPLWSALVTGRSLLTVLKNKLLRLKEARCSTRPTNTEPAVTGDPWSNRVGGTVRFSTISIMEIVCAHLWRQKWRKWMWMLMDNRCSTGYCVVDGAKVCQTMAYWCSKFANFFLFAPVFFVFVFFNRTAFSTTTRSPVMTSDSRRLLSQWHLSAAPSWKAAGQSHVLCMC